MKDVKKWFTKSSESQPRLIRLSWRGGVWGWWEIDRISPVAWDGVWLRMTSPPWVLAGCSTHPIFFLQQYTHGRPPWHWRKFSIKSKNWSRKNGYLYSSFCTSLASCSDCSFIKRTQRHWTVLGVDLGQLSVLNNVILAKRGNEGAHLKCVEILPSEGRRIAWDDTLPSTPTPFLFR